MTTWQLLKRPSAFVPLALSILALAIVLGYLLRYGPAPQPDEGAAAHIWQLLMALQVPVVAFFVVRWFPQAPRQTSGAFLVQVAAALVAALPVFLLHW